MKVPFVLKSILIAMILCYVSASFIASDVNPINWTSTARTTTVVIAWSLGIFYAIIKHLNKQND